MGVGIDCEHKDRPFKKELLTKFSCDEDSYESILSLWCAKEAAFKASSYFWKQQKTFVLKDIVINDQKFSIPDLLEGTIAFDYAGDFLITRAIVTKLLS